MQEELTMSTREIDRLKVIHQVLEHRLNWLQAAAQLTLSKRQIGRLCARVRTEGNRGIIHRLRGKPSNHQLIPGVVKKAVELVSSRYADFGPTFANEKLKAIHGLKLSTFTLRQGMIDAGLWRTRKLRAIHRSWRPRRSCVGELIQLDGSEHDWFEGRRERCVLVIYIDDATSRILYGQFVPTEDTRQLLYCTQAYLKRYGRPGAFYVDKDSIYKINRQATIEEQLRDSQPLTQFTRAMGELNIQVIAANSPQAKGRVERSFDTHQDRLVKELRLAKIVTLKAANCFLEQVYLPAHNAAFAVAPANASDAHRRLLKSHRLEEILSWRSERTLLNDFTLRYENQWFQLLREQPVRVRPKVRLNVERRLDGSIHLRFKGHSLNFTPIPKPALRIVVKGVLRVNPQVVAGSSRPVGTLPGHPWKRLYRTMLNHA